MYNTYLFVRTGSNPCHRLNFHGTSIPIKLTGETKWSKDMVVLHIPSWPGSQGLNSGEPRIQDPKIQDLPQQRTLVSSDEQRGMKREREREEKKRLSPSIQPSIRASLKNSKTTLGAHEDDDPS